MISECFSGLEHAVTAFVPQLLPTFLKFTNDSNADVRNNAIFGIGELAFHGKDAVYSYPFNKICSLHFTIVYIYIYICTHTHTYIFLIINIIVTILTFYKCYQVLLLKNRT